jgi:hypothetical protein
MIITARQVNALAELIEQADGLVNNDLPTLEERAIYMLLRGAYVLPCEIGDIVWCIRNYKGAKVALTGIVSEMSFIGDMRLSIAVRGVGRGEWGKKVFATREECERAINAN